MDRSMEKVIGDKKYIRKERLFQCLSDQIKPQRKACHIYNFVYNTIQSPSAPMTRPKDNPDFPSGDYFEALVSTMALRRKLQAIAGRRRHFVKPVDDEQVLQWAEQDLGLTKLEIWGLMNHYGIDINGEWKRLAGFQGSTQKQEQEYIVSVYRKHGDNIAAAARELELSEHALRIRIIMLRVFDE